MKKKYLAIEFIIFLFLHSYFSIFAVPVRSSPSPSPVRITNPSTSPKPSPTVAEIKAAEEAAKSAENTNLGDKAYLDITKNIKDQLNEALKENPNDTDSFSAMVRASDLVSTLASKKNELARDGITPERMEAAIWTREYLAANNKVSKYDETSFGAVYEQILGGVNLKGFRTSTLAKQLALDISNAKKQGSFLKELDKPTLKIAQAPAISSASKTTSQKKAAMASSSGSQSSAAVAAATTSGASTGTSTTPSTASRQLVAQVLNAGPNVWISTGNNPSGSMYFQRGLSGARSPIDVEVGMGGSGGNEFLNLLNGNVDGSWRSVAGFSNISDSARTMQEINSIYAMPFAVRGKVENGTRLKRGLMPFLFPRFYFLKNLSASDISDIGIFTNADYTIKASQRYIEFVEQQRAAGFSFEANSRGAQYFSAVQSKLSELKTVFGFTINGGVIRKGLREINKQYSTGANDQALVNVSAPESDINLDQLSSATGHVVDNISLSGSDSSGNQSFEAQLPGWQNATPAGRLQIVQNLIDESPPSSDAQLNAGNGPTDGPGPGAINPNIMPLVVRDISEVQSEELKDFLAAGGDIPANVKDSPALQKALNQIASVLTRMQITDAEKAEKIHLVLLRDFSVNAFFSKLENGEKIVGINLGLLQKISKDSWLTFVLGHEYEHGFSEIDEVVDRRRASNDINELEAKAILRTHENEVDGKGALIRMQEVGDSPYDGIEFLEYLRSKSQDGGRGGTTHTSTSSRIDTLALAITSVKHVYGGNIIPQPPPGQHQWVHDLQRDYFDKGIPQNEVRADIERLLNTPSIEAENRFKKYADYDFVSLFTGSYGKEIEKVWSDRAQEIDRLGNGAFPKSEMDAYKLRLVQTAEREMDAARENALKTMDLTIDKLRMLYKSEERHDYDAYIKERRDKITSSQAKIAEIDRKISDSNDSTTIEKLNKDRARIQDEIKQAQESIAGYEAAKTENAYFDNRARERSYQWTEQILGKLNTATALEIPECLKLFFRLPPDRQLRQYETVKNFLVSDFSDLTRGSMVNSSNDEIRRFFAFAIAKDPIRGVQDLRSYLEKVDFIPIFIGEDSWGREDFLKRPECKQMVATFLGSKTSDLLTYLVGRNGGSLVLDDFDSIGALIEVGHLRSDFWAQPAARQTLNNLMDGTINYYRNLLTGEAKNLTNREILILLASQHYNNYGINRVAVSSLGISQQQILQESLVLLKDSRCTPEALKRIMDDPNFFVLLELYGDIRNPDLAHNKNFFDFLVLLRKKDVQIDFNSRPRGRVPVDLDYSISLQFADYLKTNHPEMEREYWDVLSPSSRNSRPSSDGPAIDYSRKLDVYQTAKLNAFYNYGEPAVGAAERAAQIGEAARNWIDKFNMEYYLELPIWTAREERGPIFFLESFLNGIQGDTLDNAIRYGDGFLWMFTSEAVAAISAGKVPPSENARLVAYLEKLIDLKINREGDADKIFEHLWNQENLSPELRNRLARPETTHALYYSSNKAKVVDHALEQRFHLNATYEALKQAKLEADLEHNPLPQNSEVRPVVLEALALIETHLPEKSYFRNTFINNVAEKFISSEAETAALFSSEHFVGEANWAESKSLMMLDAPQQIMGFISSHEERWQVLNYFLNKSSLQETCSSMVRWQDAEADGRQMIEKVLSSAHRVFVENAVDVRTYLLTPFLDLQTGLLSDPNYSERVYGLVLGENKNDKVARALFDAYMGAQPRHDQRIILANILAGFIDGDESKASLAKILESMTALGKKAGQALLASGLAKGQLAKDLENFFDRVDEPFRNEAIERLKTAFEGTGVHFVHFEQLAGAGSVNYVQVATVRIDGEPGLKRVAFRLLRPNEIGKVSNQNTVWEKTELALKANPDPEIKMIGTILGEIRSNAMETLKAGGAEVDARGERAKIELGKTAYEGQGKTYKIEVVKIEDSVQSRVPVKHQSEITALEFIDAVPHKDDPAFALDVFEAENKAAVERGVANTDGHQGNWMKRRDGSAAVRIDLPQTFIFDPAVNQAFNDAFGVFLYPMPSSAQTDLATRAFGKLISESVQITSADMKGWMSESAFPSNDKPIERLFYIRDRVEEKFRRVSGSNDVTVRFHTDAQKRIAHFSRLGTFKDTIGSWKALAVLQKYFPISRTEIAVQTVLSKGLNVLKSLYGLLSFSAIFSSNDSTAIPVTTPADDATIALNEKAATAATEIGRPAGTRSAPRPDQVGLRLALTAAEVSVILTGGVIATDKLQGRALDYRDANKTVYIDVNVDRSRLTAIQNCRDCYSFSGETLRDAIMGRDYVLTFNSDANVASDISNLKEQFHWNTVAPDVTPLDPARLTPGDILTRRLNPNPVPGPGKTIVHVSMTGEEYLAFVKRSAANGAGGVIPADYWSATQMSSGASVVGPVTIQIEVPTANLTEVQSGKGLIPIADIQAAFNSHKLIGFQFTFSPDNAMGAAVSYRDLAMANGRVPKSGDVDFHLYEAVTEVLSRPLTATPFIEVSPDSVMRDPLTWTFQEHAGSVVRQFQAGTASSPEINGVINRPLANGSTETVRINGVTSGNAQAWMKAGSTITYVAPSSSVTGQALNDFSYRNGVYTETPERAYFLGADPMASWSYTGAHLNNSLGTLGGLNTSGLLIMSVDTTPALSFSQGGPVVIATRAVDTPALVADSAPTTTGWAAIEGRFHAWQSGVTSRAGKLTLRGIGSAVFVVDLIGQDILQGGALKALDSLDRDPSGGKIWSEFGRGAELAVEEIITDRGPSILANLYGFGALNSLAPTLASPVGYIMGAHGLLSAAAEVSTAFYGRDQKWISQANVYDANGQFNLAASENQRRATQEFLEWQNADLNWFTRGELKAGELYKPVAEKIGTTLKPVGDNYDSFKVDAVELGDFMGENLRRIKNGTFDMAQALRVWEGLGKKAEFEAAQQSADNILGIILAENEKMKELNGNLELEFEPDRFKNGIPGFKTISEQLDKNIAAKVDRFKAEQAAAENEMNPLNLPKIDSPEWRNNLVRAAAVEKQKSAEALALVNAAVELVKSAEGYIGATDKYLSLMSYNTERFDKVTETLFPLSPLSADPLDTPLLAENFQFSLDTFSKYYEDNILHTESGSAGANINFTFALAVENTSYTKVMGTTPATPAELGESFDIYNPAIWSISLNQYSGGTGGFFQTNSALNWMTDLWNTSNAEQDFTSVSYDLYKPYNPSELVSNTRPRSAKEDLDLFVAAQGAFGSAAQSGIYGVSRDTQIFSSGGFNDCLFKPGVTCKCEGGYMRNQYGTSVGTCSAMDAQNANYYNGGVIGRVNDTCKTSSGAGWGCSCNRNSDCNYSTSCISGKCDYKASENDRCDDSDDCSSPSNECTGGYCKNRYGGSQCYSDISCSIGQKCINSKCCNTYSGTGCY